MKLVASDMRFTLKEGRLAPFFVVFTALLCLAPRSWGQAASAPSAVDVVLQVHPLEPDSSSFRAIIVSVIQNGLAERGLVTTLLADSPSSDTNSPAAARATGAVALLVCRFSAAGSTLDLSFSWSDLDRKTTTATSEKKGPLDIKMDELVLEGIDGLLALEKDRVDSLSAARARQQAAAASAKAPAATPAVSPEAAPVSAAAAPAPASAPPPVQAPLPPQAPVLLVLDAGGSGFVPLGPASAYFSIAGGPSLLAGLDFSVPPGRFAIGLFASSIIFSAVGPADTATGFLIPIGPDARYAIGSGNPLTVFAHLAGGPALLVLSTATQGTTTGITGFLKSGFGMGYMFGPKFGLELTVDYEIYFELPYMIMGISSTFQASVKL